MGFRALRLALVLLTAVPACTSLLGVNDVPDPQDASTTRDATTGRDAAPGDSALAEAAAGDAGSNDAATCASGESRCDGLQPQSCEMGQWVNAGASCSTVCNTGSCTTCAPGAEQCNGPQPQACSDAGLWQSVGSACQYECDAGGCVTYVDVVKADQPLAYWRLGDPDGSPTAVDLTGHYNGSYQGAVTLQQAGAIASDPSSRSVYMNMGNAATGYVSVTGGPFVFAGEQDFSLEAWVQPTLIDNSYRGIVSDESDGDAGKEGYVLYLGGFTSGPSGLGFDRYQNGSSTPLHDASAVTQGSGWFHVVAVYQKVTPPSMGPTMTLYVNGQIAASSPTIIQIQAFGGCTFDIGATLCGHGTFVGKIAEVAVYASALSAGRIQTHYAAAQ